MLQGRAINSNLAYIRSNMPQLTWGDRFGFFHGNLLMASTECHIFELFVLVPDQAPHFAPELRTKPHGGLLKENPIG